MGNELGAVSRRLAQNIATLRKRRGMSQDALAQLARIPRSTITHLESGGGNPSLGNLTRVAAALQISIEELIAEPRSDVKLVKAADVRAVKRSQGAALVLKLLPDPIPGMEIDRMELVPGGRLGGIPHVSGTKEYLTCIQGELTVHIGATVCAAQLG
ncbi:MAG: helix-turn-helix domain-containing protein, partial [Deltaproteobacteria bacterium]|nr:helix-turn-helix domain-containing protein [Deltaproteobacteria bacterium]